MPLVQIYPPTAEGKALSDRIAAHPIIPVGYDETRAWVARYPLGEVAKLLRRERNSPRVPPVPSRPTVIGLSPASRAALDAGLESAKACPQGVYLGSFARDAL